MNSSKLNKFLRSEVNLLIQHIIVQDQYGQNNNRILVGVTWLMKVYDIVGFHSDFPSVKK